MGFQIQGTSVTAEVAADKSLRVIAPNTRTADGNPLIDGGYGIVVCESDAGDVTGEAMQRQVDVSSKYRMRTSIDTLLFNEQFNGSALNTTLWSTTLTTFTVAVTGGFLVLNSGAAVTANAVARISSYRGYPAYGAFPLQLEVEAIYVSTAFQANATVEIGFGFASGVAAPTDGAFFRYKPDGTMCAGIVFNSSETLSATFTQPSINVRHNYVIVLGNDNVEFWIDDVLMSNLDVSDTAAMPLLNQNTPVLLRLYNSAVAPNAAVQLKVAQVNILLGDNNTVKDWAHIQAGMGGVCSQGQTGGTLGTTALYANSANPTAAVPTNTTAALGSGLGGNFWSTASLAVNTDGIVSSYQSPVSAAAAPSKMLYITGVTINSAVQTILAGGPFVLQWGLAYGHTSVSLATTEGVLSKAPRRVALGIQVFAAAAAVGSLGQTISQQFLTPIPVQPGEFIQTIYKNIGTVGTSGTIAHSVTFDGYWE